MSAAAKDSLINQIFVGDLPRDISADWLVSLFSPYGDIIEPPTIRQYPAASTAFVTFATHEQAELAIREVNYTKINGMPIHIQWRDSARTHNPDANLVITNLPTSVEESELHEAMSNYGSVESCCIRRNKTGESTGVAFVQFENAEDARNAHDSLKGASIKGQLITVEFFKPMDKRQDVLTRLPPTVICVEGPDITESVLQGLFGVFGEVSNTFVIDGFGIVLYENQGSAARANAEFRHDKLNVAMQVRKEVQQAVLRKIEARRVFISDLSEEDEAGLSKLLGTCGKLGTLELHPRPNGEVVGIAQYITEEDRNAAVQTLSGKCFGNQVTPIKVLPFYDKRLRHPSAGLLQVNEVKASTTAQDLRESMSQFGTVVTTALVATSHAVCIGYVLFDRYEYAMKAHEQVVNSFLYPMVDANEVVGAFCDNLRARCVAVYNLPAEETNDSLQEMLASYGPMESLWIANEGGHKIAFAYYLSREAVVEAIKQLKAKGYQIEIFGPHIMMRAGMMMNTMNQRKEMREGMLFVSGLGPFVDSRRLREIFEQVGPVDAAMVIYNANNGVSTEKGTVLFKESQDAAAALQSPPVSSDFTAAFRISEFRRKEERNVPQQQRQPQQQAAPVPPQRGRAPANYKPRDSLRQYVRQNAPVDKQQKIIDAIDQLCLQAVYDFAAAPTEFHAWIEQQMK